MHVADPGSILNEIPILYDPLGSAWEHCQIWPQISQQIKGQCGARDVAQGLLFSKVDEGDQDIKNLWF